MKAITLLVFLFIAINLPAQDYLYGFQDGYRKGYCYNDASCNSPNPPNAPTPNTGESYYSYQDGYNRGFQMGLDDKRRGNSSSNSYYNGNSGRKLISPPTYIPPIDLNIYERGLRYKAEQEQQILYQRGKFLKEFYDYLSELDRQFVVCYPSYTNNMQEIRNYLSKISNSDLLNNDSWTVIKNYMENEEQYYITNINNCNNR
jgi:hypothetical protein